MSSGSEKRRGLWLMGAVGAGVDERSRFCDYVGLAFMLCLEIRKCRRV